MNNFIYFLLTVGILFLVFGIRLLCQSEYVKKLMNGVWKQKVGNFSEKDQYMYNRYIRGVELIFGGLILIVYSIYVLFF
jgi:hypothetical protein